MKRNIIILIVSFLFLISPYTVNAENNINSILYVIANVIKMTENIDMLNAPLKQEEKEIELTDKSKAYSLLFNAVYDIDTGLNSDIKYISFVTSTFENFSEDDKASFFKYIENKYNVEVLEKDFEQLKDEGYIKDLYFKEGILFKIDEYYENNDNVISVSAEKWRSGLGAIWVDTKVVKENNEWILSKADMTAIS